MENEIYQEAKDLYVKQQFNESIEKFKECIKQKINISQCHEYIAKAYYSLKDMLKAEENFKLSIKSDPLNLSSLYAYGIIEITFAKYKEAYTTFKTLLDYDNTKIDINVGFAASLFGMRKVLDAKEVILNAIKYEREHSDEDAKPNLMCAQIYLVILNELGNHQTVLQKIDEMNLEILYPMIKEIKQQKISAYIGLKEYKKALDLIDSNIDSDNTLNYYKAKICFEQENYPEAEIYCLKAIESLKELNQKNQYYLYYYFLGQIYDKVHKDDKTIIDAYKQSIRLCPEFIDGYIEIAKIHMNYAKYNNALNILNAAYKIVDNDIQRTNEIKLRLYIVKVKALNMNRANAKQDLIQIRNELVQEKVRKQYSTKKIIEIIEFYFEIHHLCNFYKEEQLNIERDIRIGEGSSSAVFKGRLEEQEVAVKEFKYHKAIYGEDNEKRLKAATQIFFEVYYMEELIERGKDNETSKNILSVLAIFVLHKNQKIAVVTPLCKGKSLLDLIRNSKNNPISDRAKLLILLDLGKTIQYLQSFDPPYIHHDIKSSNVLLLNKFNNDGANEIRLCDFGLMEHQTTIVFGYTPTHAAPEIILGDTNYNKKSSEVYSFAMICWELLAEKIAYEGMNAREIEEKVSQGIRPTLDELKESTPIELRKLIAKCFDNDKNHRPRIEEFVSAIKNAIGRVYN